MSDKYSLRNCAQEISNPTPDHRNLRSRFSAVALTGCLALSLCPVTALAAQPGQDMPSEGQSAMQQVFDAQDVQWANQPSDQGAGQQGMQQGGAPEQQGIQQGYAPEQQGQPSDVQGDMQGQPADMQGLPSDTEGQPSDMPSDMQGQPIDMQGGAPGIQQGFEQMNQGFDAFGNQVRQILADTYGLPAFDGAFQGDAADAPEIPEGEVDIQAVIDSARDVTLEYKDLGAADFDDDGFVAELTQFIEKAADQRFEMVEGGMFSNEAAMPGFEAPQGNFEAPSDLPAPAEGAEAPEGAAPEGGAPEGAEAPEGAAPSSEAPEGEAPEDAPENAPADASGSFPAFDQLISFLKGLFTA